MSDDKNSEKILKRLDELIYNCIYLESVLITKLPHILEDEVLQLGARIFTLNELYCCRNEIKKLLLGEGENSNV